MSERPRIKDVFEGHSEEEVPLASYAGVGALLDLILARGAVTGRAS